MNNAPDYVLNMPIIGNGATIVFVAAIWGFVACIVKAIRIEAAAADKDGE